MKIKTKILIGAAFLFCIAPVKMTSNKSDVMPTEISVYRLTHSYQEDLERISWDIRSTDASNFVNGKWIWPTDQRKTPTTVEPSTFPLRLTHAYAPTYDYTSKVSTEQSSSTTTTWTEQTFSTETTTQGSNETVVNDDPVVALADISAVLYEDSQSSVPGLDLIRKLL